MTEDSRNEFVDLEPYLIPETKKLLAEIESKNPFKVYLRKVYDHRETWQINNINPYVIDMPSWDDTENKAMFTHELLHIYLDFCSDMYISIYKQKALTAPYDKPNGEFINQHLIVSILNNLQHHKMLPLFLESGFKREEFISNYSDFSKVELGIQIMIKKEMAPINHPFHRYAEALSYADYLCLEKYAINPFDKVTMVEKYSKQLKEKFPYLHDHFIPIVESWEERMDLKEILIELNLVAKDYAEGK